MGSNFTRVSAEEVFIIEIRDNVMNAAQYIDDEALEVGSNGSDDEDEPKARKAQPKPKGGRRASQPKAKTQEVAGSSTVKKGGRKSKAKAASPVAGEAT